MTFTPTRQSTVAHDIAERAQRYLRPLLNFARDEIRAQEALGNLPRGQLKAEDMVDEALLAALLRSDEAETNGRRRLYPWLRQLVRRAVLRAVDDARQHRARSLFEPVGTGRPDDYASDNPRRLIEVLPDPSAPIPEQVALSHEFQEALAALLRQMPIEWREPFLLQVRDGLSIREVANLEGTPVGEARQRVARAREFIRARLAEEYQDSGLPPPTEDLFLLLERIEPTPEQRARTKARLAAAAA